MTPTEVDLTGTNPGSYPHLESWEWSIPAYLFLGGLVAGLMIFAAVIRLRMPDRYTRALALLDWLGLPILAAGLLLLWLDLSNRWNAWRFFTTFRLSSAMSWGSWILLLTGILLLLRLAARTTRMEPPRRLGFLWAMLRPLGERTARLDRGLDIATIVLGVSLGLYTGVLLSQIAARPLWDSAFLAPLFLASGIASGGAFLCLFLEREEHLSLAPFSMATCGVEIALLVGYLATTGSGALTGDTASSVLVSGDFALAFWLLVVAAGLAVPLLIETVELVRRHVPAVIARTAPALKLVGGAALRFVVVFAGLETFL
jgi:formate-dependent nitrite reductase membrane component NrfD